jgi:hypothetical protein
MPRLTNAQKQENYRKRKQEAEEGSQRPKKLEDIGAGGVAIFERKEALTLAIKHELLGLDDQYYRMRAACSKGDVCAAEVEISGITTLLVSAYISPGTSPDDLKFFLLRFFMAYTPKAADAFRITKERKLHEMPVLLTGDFILDRPERENFLQLRHLWRREKR